ncbi:MAG: sphinganine kinase lcb4 [Watsoniomyces obsoletus]|nr:MAG: sphinganine kinase lcb4 [Watsoniomyces obsoletus]
MTDKDKQPSDEKPKEIIVITDDDDDEQLDILETPRDNGTSTRPRRPTHNRRREPTTSEPMMTRQRAKVFSHVLITKRPSPCRSPRAKSEAKLKLSRDQEEPTAYESDDNPFRSNARARQTLNGTQPKLAANKHGKNINGRKDESEGESEERSTAGDENMWRDQVHAKMDGDKPEVESAEKKEPKRKHEEKSVNGAEKRVRDQVRAKMGQKKPEVKSAEKNELKRKNEKTSEAEPAANKKLKLDGKTSKAKSVANKELKLDGKKSEAKPAAKKDLKRKDGKKVAANNLALNTGGVNGNGSLLNGTSPGITWSWSTPSINQSASDVRNTLGRASSVSSEEAAPTRKSTPGSRKRGVRQIVVSETESESDDPRPVEPMTNGSTVPVPIREQLQGQITEQRRTWLQRLEASNATTPNEAAVSFRNDFDDSTPPLEFEFIKECTLGEGVHRADEGTMSGCTCKKDNGRKVGCEYTSCECLNDSALYEGRKRFPYHCRGPLSGCLQSFILNSRNHIFECNRLCNCGPECKNKVVQHGRKVKLEIFKTADRGFGVRCLQDLRRGEFIDIYKGEVITWAEADRREQNAKQRLESYLYVLDKFSDEVGIANEDQYVIDGRVSGGVTRFMNHSCEPNCRQFTVSYNHADVRLYDLAFFAIHHIPAGTELTFDYIDTEDEERKARGEEVDGDGGADPKERQKGRPPQKCLCGAKKCRKYLWI